MFPIVPKKHPIPALVQLRYKFFRESLRRVGAHLLFKLFNINTVVEKVTLFDLSVPEVIARLMCFVIIFDCLFLDMIGTFNVYVEKILFWTKI